MSEPSLVRTSTADLYDAHVMRNYARAALTLVRGAGCRVWDDAGKASAWSKPAIFSTGLREWKAEWIGFDKYFLLTLSPG